MHIRVCIFQTVKFDGLKKSNLGLKTQAGLSKMNVPLMYSSPTSFDDVSIGDTARGFFYNMFSNMIFLVLAHHCLNSSTKTREINTDLR
jgi:hypothetical protein